MNAFCKSPLLTKLKLNPWSRHPSLRLLQLHLPAFPSSTTYSTSQSQGSCQRYPQIPISVAFSRSSVFLENATPHNYHKKLHILQNYCEIAISFLNPEISVISLSLFLPQTLRCFTLNLQLFTCGFQTRQ